MSMKIAKKICLIVFVVILAGVYSYGVWPRAIYDTDIGSGSYENTGALDGNQMMQQQFTCEDQGLCGFSIKLTKLNNQKIGNYNWTILETESGKEIANGIINESMTENDAFESSNAQKRGNIKLDFPRQENSKGKQYLLTLQAEDVDEEESVAVYMTEKGDTDSVLKVNGENLEKASIIKLQYKRFNVETFIVFLGIMVYLRVFIKFMYKLFR